MLLARILTEDITNSPLVFPSNLNVCSFLKESRGDGEELDEMTGARALGTFQPGESRVA